MPCAAVEICKQCSSAAEALPQQRRSRGTASFTKVRAPLLATRAEKPAKMHSDCQKREGAGRTAAPDHAMVSSSDRHRETPPTSTKPTTKTTMSCEAMGAAHSIAWSPLAPGAAAGRPPSPLAETAGGAARRATTRQADATISECCTRGCTLCFLSGRRIAPLAPAFYAKFGADTISTYRGRKRNGSSRPFYILWNGVPSHPHRSPRQASVRVAKMCDRHRRH